MSDLIARTAWATDRHAAYVNLQAYQHLADAMRKEFGWPVIDGTTFDYLRSKRAAAV